MDMEPTENVCCGDVDGKGDDNSTILSENYLVDHEHDFKKFQRLCNDLDGFREKLQIDIKFNNTKYVSNVWKYFGDLKYKGRHLYKEKIFCHPCLFKMESAFLLKP